MTDARLDELIRVGGPVSRETYERLLRFAEAAQRWTSRINLIAPSTVGELWSRHICDSAQLARFAVPGQVWIDLGSGGGFPAGILAIMCPQTHFVLVESNRKKAAFLKAEVEARCSNVRVAAIRVEEAPAAFSRADIVSARALASLDRLLELSQPWLLAGAKGIYQKGRDYRREIDQARGGWEFDLVEHPSLIEHGAAALELSGLRRRS